MTRVMFDTNVLISAVFSAASSPAQSILRADDLKCELCICDEIRREFLEKFEQKWPELLPDAKEFMVRIKFRNVPTPEHGDGEEACIRDVDDWPIYRAAKAAGIDYLVTGDKDLLEFSGAAIHVVNPATFLDISKTFVPVEQFDSAFPEYQAFIDYVAEEYKHENS